MPEILPIKLESKFIAIEGPVGSGKTSLAKKLSDYVDGKLILEKPEDNPRTRMGFSQIRWDKMAKCSFFRQKTIYLK